MNSFSEFCSQYGQGNLDHLVADSLREVVRAVLETEKVGKLTLTIKLTSNGGGQILCESDVKTAVPKPSVGGAIFFATEDGDLLRRDPKQGELTLREVEPKSTNYRKIGQ